MRLIDWLIKDPGNKAVAADGFVRTLAATEPTDRRDSSSIYTSG